MGRFLQATAVVIAASVAALLMAFQCGDPSPRVPGVRVLDANGEESGLWL